MITVDQELILAEDQLRQVQEEVAKWGENAKKALNKGREDLAREALKKQDECEQKAATLKAGVDQIKSVQNTLREKIQDMENKKNRLVQNSATVSARATVADATMRTLEALERVGGENSDASIDSVENRLKRKEAEMQARLNQASRKTTLEDQFAELDNDAGAGSIDARLTALKKSMGQE